MRFRSLPLAAAVLTALYAPGAHAQSLVACENGVAGGYPCSGVDLYARLSLFSFTSPGSGPPSASSELWGWTDAETGHEYALVGLTNGTAFVDITDPDAPVYLGKLPQPSGVSSSIWRTLRVYADHVFIGSEANGHGIQVFDLTRLRDVPSPPATFTEDARYTGTGNAHTLVIDESSGYLYVAGGNDFNSTGCDGGGLHIVDVRSPQSPTFAGCFDDDGYTHEADCRFYDGPDTDYFGQELCVAYNEDHVAFVDVSDKANPTLISRAYYPNTGYTHQGWFTDDKRHLLLDDEFDPANPGTRTIVMDVEDLDDPSYAFSYYGSARTTAHNLYVRGQYAFLSNYEGGLKILDVSDVSQGGFVEVASFDTYPQGNSTGYDGQWHNYPFFASGTVIANDQNNGLFILKPDVLTTAAEPPAPGVPAGAGYALSAPTPNPFRDGAALTLAVARTQAVLAEVLDGAGRRVAVLHDGPVAAGAPATLVLDGAALPSGLYLVRVVGEDFTATRRASLVR